MKIRKVLNNNHYSIIKMETRKVIMSNGNEYELLWDSEKIDENFYEMIDLQKGWVKINKNFVSEIIVLGQLSEKKSIHPKVKKEIIDYYGEFYLN